MKLPRPVRVGAHAWPLLRMKGPIPDGAPYDADDHGCTDFDSQTIFIAARVIRRGGALLTETVLHELQHVINQHCGVIDGSTEEHFTTQSAMGWTQVFRDNPHLIAWVQDCLTPKKPKEPPVDNPK